MADFDLEQLRMLFENLGDKLDKTQGDKLSREELVRIRSIMDKMSRSIDDQRKEMKQTASDTITQFWSEWKSNNPMGPVVSRLDQQPRGTIIQEEQQRRNPDADIAFQKAELSASDGLKNVKKSSDEASSGLTGFVKNLKSSGIVAGVTAAGTGLVGAITGQTDAYRTLKEAGDGSIGSIQEMNNAAINAHMSVQEFAENLKAGSAGLKQLGGFKFATLTGALTKNTNAFGNMAMSFDQRNEAINQYLEVQSASGQLQKLTQEDMLNGIQRIVKSGEETASILGITREEALKAQAEQARDHAMNAVIRTMNLDENSVRSSSQLAKDSFGDVGESLLKQLIAGVAPQGEAATLAATDPAAYKMLQNLANQLKGGATVDPKQAAAMFQQYADQNRNSDLSFYKAQLAIGTNSPLNSVFSASLQAQDKAASYNTDEMVDKTGDPGTREALRLEETRRTVTTAANAAIVSMTNSILNNYAPAMQSFNDNVQSAAQSAIDFANGLQESPGLMGGLGIGIITVSAALVGLLASIKVVRGAMIAFKAIGSILGRGGAAGAGAGGAAGGAAGRTVIDRLMGRAGAGAAGAAGEGAAAGSSWIGRLMGGGGAAAGAAGAGASRGVLGTLGKVGGGLLRAGGKFGGAPLGALLESTDYLFGDKAFSWKNLAKSGLRVGGGAIGGTLGSALGPLGTIAGGAGGYMAGDKLANWLLGEDDKKTPTPRPATPANRPAQNIRRPVEQRPHQTNASNALPQSTLSPQQVNQKIMEANERSANYLKNMKENSDKLVDMTREEIAIMRSSNDRITRLLEEGNRNTRSIAENGA